MIGKNLWGYVSGTEVRPSIAGATPTLAETKALNQWNEKDKMVMFILSQNMSNSMIGHIQELETSKEVWKNLENLFTSTTKARKIQLKNELNNLKKSPQVTVNDYVLKIKDISDALSSIGSHVDDDDLVAFCLNGLREDDKWTSFITSIYVRENLPKFDQLVSMMITEEMNLQGSSSRSGQSQVFYAGTRGRGRYPQNRGRGRFFGQQQRSNQQSQHNQNQEYTRGRRGGRFYAQRGRSTGGGRNLQGNHCYICGKSGHYANNCYYRTDRNVNNYASTSNTQDDERLLMMNFVTDDTKRDTNWYIDSGCSNHMSCNGKLFENMQSPNMCGYVQTGDDNKHVIEHIGNVPLQNAYGTRNCLSDVLHVPTITKNLISVGQMVEKGLQVRFTKKGCFVEDPLKGFKLVAKGKKEGRLFTMEVNNSNCHQIFLTNDDKHVEEIDLWHKRIGHVNLQKLKYMMSHNLVTGLPLFREGNMHHVCEACQFGKQTRLPFKKENFKSSYALQLVHSDVWGPTKELSIGGNKYYVTFIDDFTRKTWIYFMKNKSDVFYYFKIFKNQVENELDANIKVLRTDGGGEYFSHEFSDYLYDCGIRRQFTCRYTPQQNGVAERKNRIIAEVARSMLNEKNLPNYFWADAVSTAMYLINRCPTAGVHGITPEEAWSGRKPDLSHLKIFGCVCYAHIPDELRTKLDVKSEKCIFIGYSLDQKGYRCYNPVTKQLRVSRDVVFDEMASWYTNTNKLQVEEFEAEPENQECPQESASLSGPTSSESVSPWKGKISDIQVDQGSSNKGKGKMVDEDQLWSIDQPNSEKGGETESTENQPRRSTRVKYPVKKLNLYNHFAYMSQVIKCNEPATFEEASRDKKWKMAMDEEIQALTDNKTWILVPKKDEMKPIGCKWVYKVKYNSDGSISRFKARLVAKGYAQKFGLDYEETFSPVVRMSTIRTVIALAAEKQWKLYQMDVKNAFLNGDLQETIYMDQPEGYVHPKFPHYVCKLEKALYGLKQAPRAWYQKLVECLTYINFQESRADPSLFVKHDGNKIVIICVYVDDLIITGNDEIGIQEVKNMLKMRFKISDLGELKFFLGIEVIKTDNGICLIQRKYIIDVLKKFGMLACKPLLLPLDANAKYQPNIGEKIENVQMYRSIVGSLLYATITRPDISYAVGVLSQFMQEPTNIHLNACRKVLRYLKGTLNFGLIYAQSDGLTLKGFCDADWAGSPYDRRSVSGFVFMLGGKTIAWSSKKQTTIALSSTEAEYKALTHATCEAIWLKRLLADLHVYQEKVNLLCDNMSSIYLANNPVFHARSKHIEVQYHYVREKVIAKEIDIQHVSTEFQVADIFTKFLDSVKLKRFNSEMNLQELQFLKCSEPEGEC